jgi:hypothetical protein
MSVFPRMLTVETVDPTASGRCRSILFSSAGVVVSPHRCGRVSAGPSARDVISRRYSASKIASEWIITSNAPASLRRGRRSGVGNRQ